MLNKILLELLSVVFFGIHLFNKKANNFEWCWIQIYILQNHQMFHQNKPIHMHATSSIKQRTTSSTTVLITSFQNVIYNCILWTIWRTLKILFSNEIRLSSLFKCSLSFSLYIFANTRSTFIWPVFSLKKLFRNSIFIKIFVYEAGLETGIDHYIISFGSGLIAFFLCIALYALAGRVLSLSYFVV